MINISVRVRSSLKNVLIEFKVSITLGGVVAHQNINSELRRFIFQAVKEQIR